MLMLLAKGVPKANWLWGPFILFFLCFDVNAEAQFNPNHGLVLQGSDGDNLGHAVLQQSHYDVKVRGLISFIEVTQTYSNPLQEVVNAQYQFPLPSDSAVFAMTMMIDQREIIGRIASKKQAKKIYKKAQKQGHKAALVEQVRGSVFTTNIANIEPQQKVQITLKFQHNVNFSDGRFNLRLPMLVAARYQNNKVQENDAFSASQTNSNQAQMLPFVEVPAGAINANSAHIDINMGLALNDITSVSHQIKVMEPSINQYAVTVGLGDFAANSDFELSFSANEIEAPESYLFSEQIADDTYYMLMMMPPSEHFVEHSYAREMIFVIDTSGSMHGTSMIQAKQALRDVLMSLDTTDSFNIIEFNSNTRAFSQYARTATYSNLQQAMSFVDSLHANGGTEIDKAFDLALSTQSRSDSVRQVIFLTDGSISNEQQVLQKIKMKLGSSRVFTIGIGATPNQYFMRKAALIGRGSYTFIANNSEVKSKIAALNKNLAHPALTNLRLLSNGKKASIAAPIADLYLSQPLVTFFKIQNNLEQLTLIGEGELGLYQHTLVLDRAIAGRGIARGFAKQEIEKLNVLENQDEIRDLALRHQLLSPYTSFVAVERENTGQVANKVSLVKTMKPAGLTFPQTGGNSLLAILVGILLLSIGLALKWRGLRIEKA